MIPNVKIILAAFIGTMWSASYVLIIFRGFTDRTYGMPIVAASCNISWEFIFTFIHPLPVLERVISAIWLMLDAAILATIVRFGPAEFGRTPRWAFFAGLAGIIAASYLAILLVADSFDMARSTLTAFIANLLMSALFLSMLQARWASRAERADPVRGQSLPIAWTKMIGTASASLATYLYLFRPYRASPVLPFIFVTIFAIDVAYIISLHLARRTVRPEAALAQRLPSATTKTDAA